MVLGLEIDWVVVGVIFVVLVVVFEEFGVIGVDGFVEIVVVLEGIIEDDVIDNFFL